jgi:Ni/Fe-hydrogenase subunit HybB-like protein
VGLQQALAVAGIPLALMAAVYTAYLFAQSKARDLWQSPLLPPHMAIQAALAGAGGLLLVAPVLDPGAGDVLAWVLAGACLCHLLFVWGEATLAHPTAHAHLAAWEMTRGRYARFFRAGLGLVALGLAAPVLGAWAVLPVLAGLLAHEHAYVQAAQAVPLA